jgi:hypothetical protein
VRAKVAIDRIPPRGEHESLAQRLGLAVTLVIRPMLSRRLVGSIFRWQCGTESSVCESVAL